MKPRVLVTRLIPEPGLKLLRTYCTVTVNPHNRPLRRSELVKYLRNCDGVLSMLTDPLDSGVIAACAKLRVIANYAVGYNNIDLTAAKAAGIIVTNTPGVLTDTTAEITWALIFSAARRVVEGDNWLREGKFKGWDPNLFLGYNVCGKTLGIIGAGRIGMATAEMSAGFRMKILYCSRSRNRKLETRLSARNVSLATLLKQSDFVSIHTPLTPATRHLIGAKELSLMKPSAILINTARGPIIDESALTDALSRKRIAYAGLDVYEREPEVNRKLMKLSNCVLLPHLGSSTQETRDRMAVMAATNLIAVLRGKRPPNPVPLPT